MYYMYVYGIPAYTNGIPDTIMYNYTTMYFTCLIYTLIDHPIINFVLLFNKLLDHYCNNGSMLGHSLTLTK